MSTPETNRHPSFACPAAEFPTKHSFERANGKIIGPHWTTHCTQCGEIPVCTQNRHDFRALSETVNGETAYSMECLDCGHKETVDEYTYAAEATHQRVGEAFEIAKANQELPKVTFQGRYIPQSRPKPQRLYRIQILKYPVDAIGLFLEGHQYIRSDWQPAGWTEYLDALAENGTKWAKDAISDGSTFFWPSETKTFKTKGAAASRAAAVNRWGGEAVVLEAEVGEFIPVAEAAARRKASRDQARVDRMKAKIRQIDPDAA